MIFSNHFRLLAVCCFSILVASGAEAASASSSQECAQMMSTAASRVTALNSISTGISAELQKPGLTQQQRAALQAQLRVVTSRVALIRTTSTRVALVPTTATACSQLQVQITQLASYPF